MRHIIAKEAIEIDRRAREEIGIPGIVLMENAGREAAQVARVMLSSADQKSAVCVCGKGNNGGDGFVCARHLINQGLDVCVFFIGDPPILKGDAKTNFLILENMTDIYIIRNAEDFEIMTDKLKKTALVIDALFGIGLLGEIREPYKTAIEAINASGKPVLSIDTPSGLDASEGKVLGVCVKASKTVTFVLPKTGFIKNQGPAYTGEVIVADISVPKKLLEQ